MTPFAAAIASVLALSLVALDRARGSEPPVPPPSPPGTLRPTVDPPGSLSALSDGGHEWLSGPAVVGALRHPDREPASDVEVRGTWTAVPDGLAWDLVLRRSGPPAGHDVAIELPILAVDRSVFTPSEHGEMEVRAYPTWAPVEYGHVGWGDGRYWVLPLASVLDRAAGRGLTIALARTGHPLPRDLVERRSGPPPPAREPGPWGRDAGGSSSIPPPARRGLAGCAARLLGAVPRVLPPGAPAGPPGGRVLVPPHPRPSGLRRNGTAECAIPLGKLLVHAPGRVPAGRGGVASVHVRPVVEARRDDDGRADPVGSSRSPRPRPPDPRLLQPHRVRRRRGTAGTGDAAARLLRDRFATSLVLDAAGSPISDLGGGGRRELQPGPSLSLRALSIRSSVTSRGSPSFDGFCGIDRLDWASALDHGHSDGVTMVGARPSSASRRRSRSASRRSAGSRTRPGSASTSTSSSGSRSSGTSTGTPTSTTSRGGSGTCSPFGRPRRHHQVPYGGDLLAFEAQLKTRLQFAVFPRMVARAFPISQQAPDPEAADLLEAHAPLFAVLHGKEQVLLTRCVEVDGPNDASLFTVPGRRWVAPITSRIRFVSRAGAPAEPIRLRVRAPGTDAARWAHVRVRQVGRLGNARSRSVTARPRSRSPTRRAPS